MSSSLKRKNWDGPASHRFSPRRNPITLAFTVVLSLALISFLMYFIHLHLQMGMVTVHPSIVSKDERRATVKSLPSEIAFRLTLRDCIPNTKVPHGDTTNECLQSTPTGSIARQRIAIMSPESRVRSLFYDWLHQVLLILYNYDQLRMNQEFEFISTSHVPPYGYGGNHGYTKIIRLVRLPLSVHFMDSTLWNNNTSPPSLFYTIEDLKQVTRQVIRWHCRLSHVAAHTALFTMEITDITMPWNELLYFILSAPNEDETHTLLPLALLETKTIRDHILQKNQNFFQTLIMPIQGSHMITPLQSNLDTLEEVLADELINTNQLQIWPCISFWDVGDTTLSQQSQFIATQLVPHCSAPFTKCVVEKDSCEEGKNPKCA